MPHYRTTRTSRTRPYNYRKAVSFSMTLKPLCVLCGSAGAGAAVFKSCSVWQPRQAASSRRQTQNKFLHVNLDSWWPAEAGRCNKQDREHRSQELMASAPKLVRTESQDRPGSVASSRLL